MTGRPAARLLDMTVHGSPLSPGPGSFDVFIGGMPAWRGISLAQAAQLLDKFKEVSESIAKATAAAAAAKGTPAGAAAEANLVSTLKDSAQQMVKLISSFGADIHVCPLTYVTVPHGPGVVIDGSQAVFTNDLPACRVGDTIQEALSINKIVAGCYTVYIGG